MIVHLVASVMTQSDFIALYIKFVGEHIVHNKILFAVIIVSWYMYMYIYVFQ